MCTEHDLLMSRRAGCVVEKPNVRRNGQAIRALSVQLTRRFRVKKERGAGMGAQDGGRAIGRDGVVQGSADNSRLTHCREPRRSGGARA